MDHVHCYGSPLGRIILKSDGNPITRLYFGDEHVSDEKFPVFDQADRWLDMYFSGYEPLEMPELCLHTTPFRKAVYDILLEIPYGSTVTYKEIAERLGNVSAQAVGNALAANPILLMIPCHRVIGSDGTLKGYAGGLERKEKLLDLERRKI